MNTTNESLHRAEGEWQQFSVTGEHAGQRLDRFLATHLPGVGRKLATQLCDSGDVRVDGQKSRKGASLVEGSLVVVRTGAWGRALPEPEMPLRIVLERDDLVIVEKIPGIPTGALVGKEGGTLCGALLSRYPEIANVGYGEREPGVLHRLDTFTSGLVLVARDQATYLALRTALSNHQIEKKYLALVRAGSLPDAGTIREKLGPEPSDKRRVRADPQGHPAVTTYEVTERGPVYDLVEASAHAAFRHQIRFHLASVGAPLLGDVLYGGPPGRLAPRHALHASYISGAAKGVLPFTAESGLFADLKAELDGSL